jgi:hypothetical protein
MKKEEVQHLEDELIYILKNQNHQQINQVPNHSNHLSLNSNSVKIYEN